jgi:hypothetical protein
VRAASGRCVGTSAGIGLSVLLFILALFPVFVGGATVNGIVLLCEPGHHYASEPAEGD